MPLSTALVVAQVAAALVLLGGMTLSFRSFQAARRADAGFDAAHVASAVVDLSSAGYSPAEGTVFFERLLDDLRREPGVEHAGLLHYPLLMMWDFGALEFGIEGRPASAGDDIRFPFNVVSPGHFETLRIPLVAGRDFGKDDDDAAEMVAIVNETMARRFWGSAEGAVGRRIRAPGWRSGSAHWRTIIGVARDIKYARLNEPPTPYVYMPVSQTYFSLMTVHVRGPRPPAEAIAHLRERIRTLDPSVAIIDARMLSDQTRLGFAIYDVAARVLGVIGLAAIALATIGIYGLVAYTVRLRVREIGIRMAIGEPRRGVVRRYLLIGARVGLIGTAVGVMLSLMATRMMSALLYGVSSTDATSLSLAAAAVPAWRASRLDPLVVLRRT